MTAITMLGTGAPRNNERLPSSQVFFIDDEPILVDCGEGATQQLLKINVPAQSIKNLWFTHLHSDHMLGYGRFLIVGWMLGRKELNIYGPKGTKKFHEQILNLLEDDIKYRLSLGRTTEGIYDVNVTEIEKPGKVSFDLPATVTAANMIHNVPTFAYRFDLSHCSIVFSGDTAPCEELTNLARGADVLIHDATFGPLKKSENETKTVSHKILENLKKEHCSVTQAADTARKVGTKKLVLTHLPSYLDVEKSIEEALKKFDGEVVIPNDLEQITVG